MLKNYLFDISCRLQEYRVLFEESGNNPGEKTLEDKFFEHEVKDNAALSFS